MFAACAAPAQTPLGERIEVDVSRAPILGTAEAPVLLVEFADFRCHYCKKAAPVVQQILEAYPQDVRLAFVHLPVVSPASGRAAVAAEAARRQQRFWAMHDALFALQGQPLREADLREAAAAMGLEVEQFSEDLRDPALLSHVRTDREQALRLGVEATPSFAVNGRLLVGAVPYETLAALIEAELAELRGGDG
ncbi:MAG: thioredoxin domain-containing protein [Myxococcota bacterium]|nr:thioredoxin domain-containing protein [bacterium]MDP7074150.1 thioredoxin domain-containing protein [Myxococcota bacterium]MDP7432342.1 thioredoxin domain-containing protein [Myxococcota bacterium]